MHIVARALVLAIAVNESLLDLRWGVREGPPPLWLFRFFRKEGLLASAG